MRISKTEYYLDIARAVSKRSTCLRRQYGCVIVKNDEIIATGYNGSPRGMDNCCDIGWCYREVNNVPHGKEYEKCLSGDTHVRLLNGTSPTIQELVKAGITETYVYAIDENGYIVPALATNIRSTGVRRDMCKIIFDDNTELICTKEHKIMMRDLSYKAACELSVGDSVMPYYGDKDNICNTWKENSSIKPTKKEKTLWSKTCKTSSIPCMYLVYDYYNNYDKNLVKGKNSPYLLHHKDTNHHNNEPSNLEMIERNYHNILHAQISNRHISKEDAKKGLETQKRMLENDENFRKMKQNIGHQNMTNLWSNKEWKEKALERCKENFNKGRMKSNKDPQAIYNRGKSKVLAGISKLYFDAGTKDIKPNEYEEYRLQYKTLGRPGIKTPKKETILKYFNSLEEALEEARYYNHKVLSVIFYDEETEVYDMEVPIFHNFAVDLGNDSGVFVHNCVAVHAEQNAIISAARSDMIGSTLYLVGFEGEKEIDAVPCAICWNLIKNSGIANIVNKNGFVSLG